MSKPSEINGSYKLGNSVFKFYAVLSVIMLILSFTTITDLKHLAVNPYSAVHQIVKNCRAVISMPFTATAFIAEGMGRPSIYYYPSGSIQKDDRGAHGIIIKRTTGTRSMVRGTFKRTINTLH